ncbi:hypothetical protein P4B35_10305 [Pontiellaceae bacterium B12227]|nr:hypothetical protein [Pontiellaceae bacterium B12227]
MKTKTNDVTGKRRKFAAVCRWTARIVGTLLIILILPFAIEYKSDLLAPPPGTLVFFLGTGIIMIGILVGWFRELAGGLISLAGFCLGFAALYSAVGAANVFYVPMALPGVLYLASAGLRHLNHLDGPDKGVKNSGG